MKKLFNFRLLILIGVLITSINSAWAGITESKVWLNNVEKNVSDLKNDDWGTQTDLTLSKFYVKAKKDGHDLWGHSYMGYNVNTGPSTTGDTDIEANSESHWYSDGGYDNCFYAEWEGSLYLSRNRLPGSYKFTFWFKSQTGQDGSGNPTYVWDSNNSSNYNVSYTIPDPTIEISGAGSLVAGTSTNITASMSDYPAGATMTNVSVSGNIASTKSNTGSSSSITVSSVIPNASGASGITVTVTVTFGSAGTKNYVYNYDVAPPAVSDFTVEPSGTGYLSSGSGTSVSPWLVTYNGTLTLDLADADDHKAYNDANSDSEYSIDGSNYGTTSSYTEKTISSITSTSNADWTFRARLKNKTTSSLLGSPKAITVYWKVATSSLILNKNGGDKNGSATATHGTTTLSPLSAPTKTGYHVTGYYTNDDTPVLIADASGNLQTSTAYTDANNKWNVTSNPTLYAHWDATTYTITLSKGTGGTTDGTATVVYDATALATKTDAVKTGYSLNGYYTAASAGTKVLNADGSFAGSDVTGYITSSKWSKADDCTLHAQWTANNYSVQFNKNNVSAGGSMSDQNFTYDEDSKALTSNAFTLDGYHFDYWTTNPDGSGTQYTDGQSVQNIATSGTLQLYAHWTQARLTDFTFDPASAAPSTSVTITPGFDPTPTGTTCICWGLYYDSECESAVDGITFTSNPSSGGDEVTFTTPATAGTYYVKGTFSTGSSCGTGDINTYVEAYVVQSSHNVTIQYKDASGNIIRTSSVIEIAAADSSDLITAPDIFGYRFLNWTLGDGITTSRGSLSASSIKVYANYDGTITANYGQNDNIYFKNTLGWSDVYVYFYTSSGYWDGTTGAGASGAACIGKGQMSLVPGETDLYYWDYGQGVTGGAALATEYVAFTNSDKTGQANFWDCQAIYPTQGGNEGFNAGTPMFIPDKDQTGVDMNCSENKCAKYFNKGYWTKYKGGTGYSIDIFYSKGGAYDKSVNFVEGNEPGMPYTATVNLTGGSTLGFKVHRSNSIYYYSTTDVTMTDASNAKTLTYHSLGTNQTGITTNASGDYVFTLTCADNGTMNISVKYPAASGDYRIVYKDLAAWSGAAHVAGWGGHPSDVIAKNTSLTEAKTDIVSFFVSKAVGASASMRFQYISAITNSSITWTDVTGGAITTAIDTIAKSGVYNFYLSQPAGGASIRVDSVRPYKGNYYIRSTMAHSKWDNYMVDGNHLMNYSDYAENNRGFSHYWVKYVNNGSDIRYVIANDYSPCISDTLIADYESSPVTTTGGTLGTSEAGVNIRSMWNQSTNKLSRAYLTGPVSNNYLALRTNYESNVEDVRVFKTWSESSNTRLTMATASDETGAPTVDSIRFTDNENWMYSVDIYARPGSSYKLTSLVNDKTQFLRGAAGDYTTAANIDSLVGGDKTVTTAYHVRMVYDFKTDRIMKAWMPSGDITNDIAINADIMIVREHQEAGQQIKFDGGSLSKVHTVYGVMRFNRWTLNNKDKSTHLSLDVAQQKSRYERGLYWISFPFNVNLSDVFGFGTYGVHWIIEEYNGAKRAHDGYWKDSEGFWEFVTNRTGKVLEAGKGYILALDLDSMRDDNTRTWANNINEVELYFPSASEVNNISAITAKTTIPSHECTINRHTQEEKDAHTDTNINKNRTIADSHWNVIGVPSYANYGISLYKDKDATQAVAWNSNPTTQDVPFLYEWQAVDNSYVVRTGTFTFKTMHGYMVQYHGDIYWKLASATPASVAARQAEVPDIEYMLSLIKDSVEEDHTFVRMSDKEGVTAGFEFGQDLCKEYNGNRGNIYTFVGYLPVAGNSQPHPLTTTIVPVGVKIAANGEYTFSMPEGTNGGDVWLIDNANSSRTNLGLMDYTVNLTSGTYEGRFSLEFPVQNVVTEIENAANANANANANADAVRKVFVGGQLYIIRDGVIYNASGARVQ